jgi:hypothetical protein
MVFNEIITEEVALYISRNYMGQFDKTSAIRVPGLFTAYTEHNGQADFCFYERLSSDSFLFVINPNKKAYTAYSGISEEDFREWFCNPNNPILFYDIKPGTNPFDNRYVGTPLVRFDGRWKHQSGSFSFFESRINIC